VSRRQVVRRAATVGATAATRRARRQQPVEPLATPAVGVAFAEKSTRIQRSAATSPDLIHAPTRIDTRIRRSALSTGTWTIQRATVVRGGACAPDSFFKGSGVVTATGRTPSKPDDKLFQISTNTDLVEAAPNGLSDLGSTMPHNTIGVADSDDIEALRGELTPSGNIRNPWHTDLGNLTKDEAAGAFKTQKNPNPKPRK